ncbi:MAG TPA: ECF-type sigma factor [Bryobacteraceae bacterium]|jgi:RNA polymerase sigma-70 factor (ECF subfamily)|nr:ECF-type sigma factor [Bryobacteraceae bacterium]
MASEITLLLYRWREGDERALHELMPLVYSELRRIAQRVMRKQRPGQTLEPTALVNEAYLKLFDSGEPQFADRAHFLAVMARTMRQVLIDYARASAAAKRGGQERRVTWDTAIQIGSGASPPQLRLLELDRAMEALSEENKTLAEIVEMHYFGGMTAEEIAVAIHRSAHSIRHELRLARAWLRGELAQ